MRRSLFGLVAVASIVWAFSAAAHFAGKPSIYFSGATPRELCYELDEDVAKDPLWVSWIDNAVAAWQKANTGWTFKKCETDKEKSHPDIRFSFNHGDKKIPGGAQGGPRTDSAWQILIEPNVNGESINGVTVKGGIDGKGWRMTNEGGDVTLDPVLVMEHELSHALGLDHADTCSKTDVEEPVCAGYHGGANGRVPSASDIEEVKKAIKFVDDAKKETEEKKTKSDDKHNARRHPHYSEDDPRYMDDYQPPAQPVHHGGTTNTDTLPPDMPGQHDDHAQPKPPYSGQPDVPQTSPPNSSGPQDNPANPH